ncbi:MAG: GTPase HflX, partial [Gemmatimonadota bacterium]|nr:GTPase HflX [Gemmatimonadota bacterium]
ALLALQARMAQASPSAIFVSATAEDGLEPLRRALAAAVRQRRPVSEIRLPAADGKLLAAIHREGEVLEQRTEGDRLIVRARVGEALAGKLRSAGAEVAAV